MIVAMPVIMRVLMIFPWPYVIHMQIVIVMAESAVSGRTKGLGMGVFMYMCV